MYVLTNLSSDQVLLTKFYDTIIYHRTNSRFWNHWSTLVSTWSLRSLPKKVERSLRLWSAGFHMIAVNATIAKKWFPHDRNNYWTFFPAIAAIVLIVAIIWKPDKIRHIKVVQFRSANTLVRSRTSRLNQVNSKWSRSPRVFLRHSHAYGTNIYIVVTMFFAC